MREGVEVLDAGSAAGRRLTESIRYFEFVGAELAQLVERGVIRGRRPGMHDEPPGVDKTNG